ncbi:ABC transporter substrate-binding protein [Oxyplasma meridianum]|uniref:ABC transporter substrate-binding protein n=1 Tax=Oxyplasma meridianum TaxID=3073602 RepID=A0AAX4NI24_9ARCH
MKAIFKNHRIMKTIVVFAVVIVAAMFIMESFSGSFNDLGTATSTHATTISSAVSPSASASSITSANGTYTQAEVGNINHLNYYSASTVCDFMLLDEIYDSPYNFMPNETYQPWLATGFNITAAPANMTTFDPITGALMPVSEIATVQIRPGVQWNDWTPANAASTYNYSTSTSFVSPSGVSCTCNYKNVTFISANGKLQTENYTQKNLTNLTMKTYYVQSADFILSWKLLYASEDLSGEYQYLVNMLPVNNLTVSYYLTAPNALFESTMLDTPILPYHIWDSHAYASTPGLWNYSASLPASDSYNAWTLGYNPTTGYAPGLVGTGPYMMYAGYGMPKGAWISSDYWQLYANPNYFVQNVPGLAQYMPKLYSIKTIIYSTYSAAVAAEASGQVQSILDIPSTFLPTVKTIPYTYTYDKPGTGYGYQQINSYSANAPFNITSLRQALEYAIPKTYLATVVAEGFSTPGSSTVIPPSDSVWRANVPYYHFDLAKAEETINATINATHGQLSYSSSGGKNYFSPGATLYYMGKPVTISIQITVASENPLGVEGANIIASDWDTLGIHTSVKEESFSTLVSNLVDLSPSSPDTYSAISLGISGIVGNPADDFITFNNNVNGIGTGFYLGPYTDFTYTGPTIHLNSTCSLSTNTNYTGTQVINLMDNLTDYMLTNSSVSGDLNASDMIQQIQAEQATFENLGYGIDIIPITNSTFTGIQKSSLPITDFWYWNFFSLHLRKVPLVTKVPVVPQHLEVGVVSNSRIYYDGQYGNVTIQVRNQYGTPINNASVTVGYTPSGALLNITSYTGVTSGNGTYRFEFKVSPLNTLIYTSDYTGEINLSASATDTSINAVGGLGSTHFDVSPQPVAYRIVSMPTLDMKDSSTFKNMTVEVYNPLDGSPVSGYSYTVQVNAGVLNMTNVTPATFSTLAGNPSTELYAPTNFGNETLGNVSMSGYTDATLTPNGTFAVALMNSTNGNIRLVNLTLNAATGMLPRDIKVGKMFKVGENPDAIQIVQVNPMNATSVWAFVANYGSSNVTAVNLTNGKTYNYNVGKNPVSIQLALNGPNDSFAYVLNKGSNNITVLNMTNMNHVFSAANISLGTGLDASDMQFAESEGYLLVSDTAKSQIEVVNITNAMGNMWSVVGNMSLGSGVMPTNISESGGMLYVQEDGTGNVAIYSLINIGFNPYLNNAGYNASSHMLVANVPIGHIKSMALAEGFLLVTSTATDNVTAIATSNVGSYSTADMIVENLTTMGTGTDITVLGSVALTTSSTELTMIGGVNNIIYQQFDMEQVQGKTNSTGEFTIGLQMVGKYTADYSLMGMNLTSYVFLGNYQSGAPVFGEAPYMDIAQLTSPTNANGFGVAQPVEIPVQITMEAPHYNISISLSSPSISSATGTDNVTVTVTNAGKPVPDYEVSLVSQNALGANRGYFTNTSGAVTGQIAVPDLNSLFGSVNLTGIQLVTNSKGIANATFYAGMYGVINKADGSLDKYVAQSFTDPYYVPADVFQLSAIGQSSASNVSTVYSMPMVNNVSPSTVMNFYVPQNIHMNGTTAVGSGKSFQLYVNSTYDLAAGPGAPNVSFTATVNYGKLSATNGTTNANGSSMLTYTAPTVSNLTLVTLTVTINGSGQNFTYTFYVAPSHVVTPSSPVIDYVIMGILGAIAVIFIGLFAMEAAKVRKMGPKTPPPSAPPTQ